MTRLSWIAALGISAAVSASAQDMMRHVDLASPDMVSAEMTRSEVEQALAAGSSANPVDFTGEGCRASICPGSISPRRSCARHG